MITLNLQCGLSAVYNFYFQCWLETWWHCDTYKWQYDKQRQCSIQYIGNIDSAENGRCQRNKTYDAHRYTRVNDKGVWERLVKSPKKKYMPFCCNAYCTEMTEFICNRLYFQISNLHVVNFFNVICIIILGVQIVMYFQTLPVCYKKWITAAMLSDSI